MPNNRLRQSWRHTAICQLQRKTFGQCARTHAHWLTRLQRSQTLLQGRNLKPGMARHFCKWRIKIPIVAQITRQKGSNLQHLWAQWHQRQLMPNICHQRPPRGQRFMGLPPNAHPQFPHQNKGVISSLSCDFIYQILGRQSQNMQGRAQRWRQPQPRTLRYICQSCARGTTRHT